MNMKKTLLSLALALLCLGANAQTKEELVFCDKDGNIYPDGAVITATEKTEDPYGGGEDYYDSGIFVGYIGEDIACNAGLALDIQHMDNGVLSQCFPNDCVIYNTPGQIVRTGTEVVYAGTYTNLRSEWVPGPGTTGYCTVVYTLRIHDNMKFYVGDGPTITVHFCNGAFPASIASAKQTNADARMYTITGQPATAKTRGLVIANGKKAVIR